MSAPTCPHTGVRIGDRIRLTHMGDDPNPIPVGTEGIVTDVEQRHPGFTTNSGQVHVQWDNNRSLALVIGTDTFSIVQRTEDDAS